MVFQESVVNDSAGITESARLPTFIGPPIQESAIQESVFHLQSIRSAWWCRQMPWSGFFWTRIQLHIFYHLHKGARNSINFNDKFLDNSYVEQYVILPTGQQYVILPRRCREYFWTCLHGRVPWDFSLIPGSRLPSIKFLNRKNPRVQSLVMSPSVRPCHHCAYYAAMLQNSFTVSLN